MWPLGPLHTIKHWAFFPRPGGRRPGRPEPVTRHRAGRRGEGSGGNSGRFSLAEPGVGGRGGGGEGERRVSGGARAERKSGGGGGGGWGKLVEGSEKPLALAARPTGGEADRVVSLAVAPPIEALIYSKEIFIPTI